MARVECTVRQLLEGRRGLRARPRRRFLRPREVLFKEGEACDAFVIVVAGVITLRKRFCGGNSLFLDLAYPGRILEWGSLVVGSLHHATALAPFRAQVCVTPVMAVREAIVRGGRAALELLRQVTLELERNQDTLLRQVTMPCQQRLQHALLQMAERHGERQEDGSWLVDLPVTRRDLACIVGTRPETISRILRAIEDAQLAHFDGRHVVIPHLEALKEVRRSSPGGAGLDVA